MYAKRLDLDVRPFSKVLGEYLVKEKSIVVVGTAGKTSTAACISYTLEKLGKSPSYMIGGEAFDLDSALKNTDSNISVLEGDEFHNIQLSSGPKFLEFSPKCLVITNIGWEHQDVFTTQEEYVEAFKKAVKLVPEDGIIIAKANDANIDLVLTEAKSKIIRYEYSNEDVSRNYPEYYRINTEGRVF